jgi:hypothetical protein
VQTAVEVTVNLQCPADEGSGQAQVTARAREILQGYRLGDLDLDLSVGVPKGTSVVRGKPNV